MSLTGLPPAQERRRAAHHSVTLAHSIDIVPAIDTGRMVKPRHLALPGTSGFQRAGQMPIGLLFCYRQRGSRAGIRGRFKAIAFKKNKLCRCGIRQVRYRNLPSHGTAVVGSIDKHWRRRSLLPARNCRVLSIARFGSEIGGHSDLLSDRRLRHSRSRDQAQS